MQTKQKCACHEPELVIGKICIFFFLKTIEHDEHALCMSLPCIYSKTAKMFSEFLLERLRKIAMLIKKRMFNLTY